MNHALSVAPGSRLAAGIAARVVLRSLLLALPFGPGCALFDKAHVGVRRVGPDAVHEQLDENALNSVHASSSTLEILHYFGLTELWEDAPDKALSGLHLASAADPQRYYLHALAELSYLRGRELHSRDHFLAASIYAYLYLLGEEGLEPPSPYDRRFRWACDLYNRGLRDAFLDPKTQTVKLEGGPRALPIGQVDISIDRSTSPIDEPDAEFLPADDYEVWGLSIRLRDSGLGAPLVARMASKEGPLARFRGKEVYAPSALFLRVRGGLADMQQGITATLELHSSLDPLEIEVAGRTVPLESDISTTLAVALDHSKLWGFSSKGFFGGEDIADANRLFMARPYQRGLIPVVFVHGTASNPANWAEMFNLLLSEPAIRERMQFWFFQYSTGNPIPFSAARLRSELAELVELVDPEGTDPALRRMVVIGHSQGGLLTKLMAVDSDMSWWNELVGVPIEEFGFPSEQEALVRSAIDFDPVPQVRRVIFLSTPHQGSFLADRFFARLINSMIAMPGDLVDVGETLLSNEKSLPTSIAPRIPTSLDNMRASNPFLQRLRRAPLAPGVKANSIIAIRDADPEHPEEADDGVVAYTSAHLEGVESECLLPTGHSCQGDPRAIAEVGRILLQHLREEP